MKKRTPLLLFTATLLALAPSALAAPQRAPVKPEKPVATAKPAPAPAIPKPIVSEQQVVMPADGPYVVSLKNLRGRVVIRAWNKNVVYVRVTRRATHPLAGTEAQMFDAIKPVVGHPEPDTVTVQTEVANQPSFPGVLASKMLHVNVDYEIAVPPETAVDVAQEWGPILVYGTHGKLNAFTRDGDVSVTGVRGWAEAGNERGKVNFLDIQGDAIGQNTHGDMSFRGVTGDIKARSSTGEVRIDVPPRFAGEVTYQTVSGEFRSDLATFETDLEPGDRGYVGILRGPLAGRGRPEVRYTIDTASGNATIATLSAR